MGCSSSKGAGRSDERRPARAVIGSPQDVQIHIPRNRADRYGVPVQQVTRDIDREVLVAALDHVSEYLAQRRKHISVIAVGGAVNTLYLRSRSTTHDVDIFGSDFNNQARMILDEAMQSAQRQFPALGTDWLNTETQMWMPGPMHQELTNAARQQHVKVYQDRGLEIYAAPWNYAFSAKVSRLLTGGAQARPYDLQDAVTYIHEYIRSNGQKPVPVAEAIGWARHYHHETNRDILLKRVNKEYRARYGAVAFV